MILRAILTNLTADTLAAHEIFEYLSPSCDSFRRTCLIKRPDFKIDYNKTAELRTQLSHDEQLREIIIDPKTKSSLYGFKGESILNSSRLFHITNNFVFDIMHDILEGVAQFDLKLIINEFINVKKYFTVSFFNSRINLFNYGASESNNKSSPNFTKKILNSKNSKITQKAIQSWLLLRSLSFLIGHKVPSDDDQNFNLIFYLLNIVEIVFSDSVSDFILPEWK